MAEFYGYSQNRFMTGNSLQNRAQLSYEAVTSAQYKQFHEMRSEMPSDVLQLFKANEVGFLKAPIKKKCRSLDPISNLAMNLTQMFAIPNLEMIEEEKRESKIQRKIRIAEEKNEKNELAIKNKIAQWNPFDLPQASSDPEKTLFVSRLSYKTTDKDLKHQFERYGVIKSVYLARDLQGNSRGYAFIEFQSKDDFNHAYKNANQRKIGGRRVIVDFERGRTILKWRPRRFGGGSGTSRLTREQAQKVQEEQKQRQAKINNKESRSKSRSRDKKDRKNDDKDNQRKKDRRDDRKDDRRDDRRDNRRDDRRDDRRDKKDRRDYRDNYR